MEEGAPTDRGERDFPQQPNPLEVGARVRHRGQQYPEAIARGTATIVEVVKQHAVDGTWEYLVKTDAGEIKSWNIVDTPIS
ncbi:hypothetical protein GCM10020255_025220 [Rhodococcus baikonurensis]